ncbi:hypothetical protein ACMHYB_11775 [Sorangium sp. So ce1128]
MLRRGYRAVQGGAAGGRGAARSAGPYDGIHDTGEPDEIPAAIAEEIEATYPGYQPIPPELGNEVVPDVDMDGVMMMGEATIYMCLFSPVWTWVDPV